MEENKDYLKRGKGKLTGEVKRYHFFLHYKKNCKEKQVSEKTYRAFLKDLLSSYSTEIVTTGLELKLVGLGRLRVRTNALHYFNKDGKRSKGLKPNWQATWEFWEKKYPGLTRQQITEIENKTVIFHENDHSQQEFYEHFWDKITSQMKFKTFYKFKPARQYSRLIAQVVKDKNRKVFYYGQ